MIDAKEARKKTLLNSKLKSLMTDVEKGIEDATQRGEYKVSVRFPDNIGMEFVDIIIKELESLGYVVRYCPVPKDDLIEGWFAVIELTISWEG